MTAIGLPSDKISLILAIDWFLDRFRTVMNVLGDSLGCAVVQANVSFDDIDQLDQKSSIKKSKFQKEAEFCSYESIRNKEERPCFLWCKVSI